MSYTVLWRPKAVKVLRKLPKEIASRIIIKVNLAKEDPFQYLERLTGLPGYKLRVGQYRVIIDLELKDKIFAIRMLGSRKDIYKHLDY